MTVEQWIAVATILFGSAGGSAGAIALYRARSDKKNTDAQTDKIETDIDVARATLQNLAVEAARGVVEDIRKQLVETQARVEVLETERDGLLDDVDDSNSKLAKIRDLFERIVKRSNITLTVEERRIFEDTQPRPPRPRRRPIR